MNQLRQAISSKEAELAAAVQARLEEVDSLTQQLSAVEAKLAVEASLKQQIDDAAQEAINDLADQLSQAQAAAKAAAEQLALAKHEQHVAAADRDAFQLQVSDLAAAKVRAC